MLEYGKKVSLLICASLLLLSHYAIADIYVSTSGSDSNPGTQAAPYRTISKASNVAPGTTVHVAPGIYSETITTLGDGNSSARIRYVSDTKWGARILPPSSSSSEIAWWSKGAYTDIIGFEIDGSNANSALLEGLYLSGSNSSAQGNHVHHIAATTAACTGNGGAGLEGDGWYGGSNIDLIGNVVNNIGFAGCTYIQGIYQTAPGKVKDNLVYAVGAFGIHLWHDANHIDIANNTVFNCGYGMVVGGGDFVHTSGPADYINVTNNIIYDNAGGGIQEHGSTGTHNTFTNNLSIGNQGYGNWYLQTSVHTADVNSDPLFVNYIRTGGGNYHLSSSSPAIDAGTSLYATALDLDGATRIQGKAIDIGAYEYPSAAPTPTPTPTPTPVPKASMSLSTKSLVFASQALGTTSSVQLVTITSNGTAALIFSSGFSMSGSFAFGGVGTCALNVSYAPGSSCTASVVFKPTAVGPQSGSLSISSNASSAPAIVALSGSGLVRPAISLSAQSLAFANQKVGTKSSVKIVTIKNIGTAPLLFSTGFIMSGDFAFGGVGTCALNVSYAPGASCTASVVFTPKAKGTRLGNLSISSNASSGPLSVSLSGTGY